MRVGLIGPLARELDRDPRRRRKLIELLLLHFAGASLWVCTLTFGDPTWDNEAAWEEQLNALDVVVTGGRASLAEREEIAYLLHRAAVRGLDTYAIVGGRLLPVEMLIDAELWARYGDLPRCQFEQLLQRKFDAGESFGTEIVVAACFDGPELRGAQNASGKLAAGRNSGSRRSAGRQLAGKSTRRRRR